MFWSVSNGFFFEPITVNVLQIFDTLSQCLTWVTAQNTWTWDNLIPILLAKTRRGLCVCSCNSNPRSPAPIKVAIAGGDAYMNMALRPYVEQFSTKSHDWQNYIKFLFIPLGKLTKQILLSCWPLLSAEVSLQRMFCRIQLPGEVSWCSRYYLQQYVPGCHLERNIWEIWKPKTRFELFSKIVVQIAIGSLVRNQWVELLLSFVQMRVWLKDLKAITLTTETLPSLHECAIWTFYPNRIYACTSSRPRFTYTARDVAKGTKPMDWRGSFGTKWLSNLCIRCWWMFLLASFMSTAVCNAYRYVRSCQQSNEVFEQCITCAAASHRRSHDYLQREKVFPVCIEPQLIFCFPFNIVNWTCSAACWLSVSSVVWTKLPTCSHHRTFTS